MNIVILEVAQLNQSSRLLPLGSDSSLAFFPVRLFAKFFGVLSLLWLAFFAKASAAPVMPSSTFPTSTLECRLLEQTQRRTFISYVHHQLLKTAILFDNLSERAEMLDASPKLSRLRTRMSEMHDQLRHANQALELLQTANRENFPFLKENAKASLTELQESSYQAINLILLIDQDPGEPLGTQPASSTQFLSFKKTGQ